MIKILSERNFPTAAAAAATAALAAEVCTPRVMRGEELLSGPPPPPELPERVELMLFLLRPPLGPLDPTRVRWPPGRGESDPTAAAEEEVREARDKGGAMGMEESDCWCWCWSLASPGVVTNPEAESRSEPVAEAAEAGESSPMGVAAAEAELLGSSSTEASGLLA